MATGQNAAGHSREYRSRRHPKGVQLWGPYGKRTTHRYERAQGKRLVREVE